MCGNSGPETQSPSRAEPGQIAVVNELGTQEQELAARHVRVFHGRDERTFDFGQKHTILRYALGWPCAMG